MTIIEFMFSYNIQKYIVFDIAIAYHKFLTIYLMQEDSNHTYIYNTFSGTCGTQPIKHGSIVKMIVCVFQ